MSKILKSISVVCLVVLNISIPVILWSNSSTFYKSQFKKHKVYEDFEQYGVPSQEAEKNFEDLQLYLQFRKNSLSEDFYSNEDIIHMKDVKNLFAVLYFTAFICLVGIVYISITYKEQLTSILHSSSIKTLIILSFVFILVWKGTFDGIFTLFHKLLFRNDFWLLDPKTSNLISFFPTELFQTQVIFIGTSIFIISLLELVVAIAYNNEKVIKPLIGKIKNYLKIADGTKQ